MQRAEGPGQDTFDRPERGQPTDDPAKSRFDWSSDEIRRVGYQVIDLIAEYLTTLPSKPVFQPLPEELAGLTTSSLWRSKRRSGAS